MKKILILALLATGFANGQIIKNVGDFNSVRVYDRISVELIASDKPKVEITGNRADEVELVNKNGELKIRMSLKELLDGEDINVRVHFIELKSIDAAEGSFIGSGQPFSQPALELTAKTGGEIQLELKVTTANVKAVTGGLIRLNGSAEKLIADLGTGGLLRAKSLQTQDAEVEIKAGGEADVRASNSVDADVKAGGNVTIYGSPKHIERSTTLGGTIRESNQ